MKKIFNLFSKSKAVIPTKDPAIEMDKLIRERLKLILPTLLYRCHTDLVCDLLAQRELLSLNTKEFLILKNRLADFLVYPLQSLKPEARALVLLGEGELKYWANRGPEDKGELTNV